MSDESRPITIKVLSDEGLIASSSVVSIGLIVTELVINAVKYAFPNGGRDSRILESWSIDMGAADIADMMAMLWYPDLRCPGFAAFVRKPFKIYDVLDIIGGLLRS